MFLANRIAKNFKVLVKSGVPIVVAPYISSDCEVYDGSDENFELLLRDSRKAVKYPGSNEHVLQQNKRIGGPSSHTNLKSSIALSWPTLIKGLTVEGEYMMLL